MVFYIIGPRTPYPMKLDTFKLMCGSESDRLKKWREQVNKACAELKESGLIHSAWVDKDRIHCKRTGDSGAADDDT